MQIYNKYVSLSEHLIMIPIRPVVSASAMTGFIRYIYNLNLQFIDNIFIIKAKVLLPQA